MPSSKKSKNDIKTQDIKVRTLSGRKSSSSSKSSSSGNNIAKIKRESNPFMSLPMPLFEWRQTDRGMELVFKFYSRGDEDDYQRTTHSSSLKVRNDKKRVDDDDDTQKMDKKKNSKPKVVKKAMIFERELNLNAKRIAKETSKLGTEVTEEFVEFILTKHFCYLLKNFGNSKLGSREKLPIESFEKILAFIISMLGDKLKERPEFFSD